MEFYRIGTRIVAGIDIAVSFLVMVIYSMCLGYMLLIVDIVHLVSPDEHKQTKFSITLALLAVIIGMAFIEMLAAFMLLAATLSGKQTSSALSLSKFWLWLNGIWVGILLVGVVRMLFAVAEHGFLEYNWITVTIVVVVTIMRINFVYVVVKFMGKIRSTTANAREEIQLRDF